MDVRCERCKTEYDFDDARITESGVTVKCTTCGHIFKVKKKALVVTVPVKPGEDLQQTAALASAAAAKEWRLRQANGSEFTFRELTTLQKWIVERKVTREDEISLTGENWKRLGNIAELATFFQVVDDAMRAHHLAAMLPKTGQTPVPPAFSRTLTPLPSVAPAVQPLVSPPTPPPLATGRLDVAPVPGGLGKTPPAPPAVPPPAPASTRPEPPALFPFEPADDSNEPRFEDSPRELPPPPPGFGGTPARKSGRGAFWAVAVLLILGGAAAYAYWELYPTWRGAHPGSLPFSLRRPEAPPEKTQPGIPPSTEPPKAPRVESDAGGVVERMDAGEPPAAVAAVAVDAGVTAGDAGTETAAAPNIPDATQRPSRPRDFDFYMAQGDRQRERERPKSALDAYAHAEELSPNRAEPIAGKGLAQLDMGNKEAAVASFQRALELNPRYGVAIMGLAEAFRALGQKEEATQYYQQYLEYFPSGSEAAVAQRALERMKE